MQSSHCTLFQGKQHFLLYNIQQSPPTEALKPFKYTELKLPTVSERTVVLVSCRVKIFRERINVFIFYIKHKDQGEENIKTNFKHICCVY